MVHKIPTLSIDQYCRAIAIGTQQNRFLVNLLFRESWTFLDGFEELCLALVRSVNALSAYGYCMAYSVGDAIFEPDKLEGAIASLPFWLQGKEEFASGSIGVVYVVGQWQV